MNYVPPEKGASKIKLSWDYYDTTCGPKALNTHTQAELQARCGDFIGESVMWTGHVTSVLVESIDNRFRALVTAMPKVLRPTLRCILGGKEIEQDLNRYNICLVVYIYHSRFVFLVLTRLHRCL